VVRLVLQSAKPNQVDIPITAASYTVTQDDIDTNSTLVNQASVTTTETGGAAVTSTASTPITTKPIACGYKGCIAKD